MGCHNTPDEDAKEARHLDALAEYKKHLIESGHTASQDFDKAIMTLAAGALGISIAFINQVAPHPQHKEWVGAAWFLFAASLVAILMSFITSQSAIRWELAHFGEEPRPTRP